MKMGRVSIQPDLCVTFRAKGIGGKNQLNVSVQRMESPTIVTYLNQTVTLTNTWQDRLSRQRSQPTRRVQRPERCSWYLASAAHLLSWMM